MRRSSGGGRRDTRHRRVQSDGAKPRRRPRGDALPSLPGSFATGDGHIRGRQARDGVPTPHPPGVQHLRTSHSIPAQCLLCATDRPSRTDIMTRLRIASLIVAVVAGNYAALMLIDGQLIHFGVAAAICAGSSIAAGLIAYADDEDARRQHELGRRRRTAVTRRQAAISEHPDQQAAAPPGQQCLLCGGARQTQSDSPRFADRQESRLCGACAPAPTHSRHEEPTAGLGASSDGRATRSGAPRDGKPRRGVTWNRVGRRRTADDPGVEVST
jgi:hypothetical protein